MRALNSFAVNGHDAVKAAELKTVTKNAMVACLGAQIGKHPFLHAALQIVSGTSFPSSQYKSRNLQTADGRKGIANAADELCGIALETE